ncbi:MAG TPA: efflux RND transporter periplasmic adaptor subunit [Sunxiuqinia sp.]|nr:efflux RND transporter periplasmic adaptor subunit [Sunxiuqinia sp.]
MKKSIKTIVYLAVAIIIGTLIFMQLSKNKRTTAQVAQLANIQGEFYPVKVQLINQTYLITNFTTTGFLESETDLNVLSQTQGTITKILKDKGSYVKAGDVIATVDDELLQAQLAATKAAYKQLVKEEARFAKLMEQNAVPSQKYEEIKLNLETTKAKYVSAKRQLEDTRIKAPVAGYVESSFIELGQFIGGGTKVCNIIDTQNLKLKISVSEQDYRNIKLGQRVSITSSVYPETKFFGKVSYLSKKAGNGNSFDTEIKVENKDKLLKAGMFVTAAITEKNDTKAIYIPRKAINGSLKDATVYKVVDDKAVSTPITIGATAENQILVLQGLKAGDQLIIAGNYSIFDGATVKIIE